MQDMHIVDHCFFKGLHKNSYRTNNFVLFCFTSYAYNWTFVLITEMASFNTLNEQQQLHIGQYFVTWDCAIEYIQKWCNIQGFQTRIDRSKHNAEGEYKKLTITCQHSGKSRKPLTELQTNKEKSSKKKLVSRFKWVVKHMLIYQGQKKIMIINMCLLQPFQMSIAMSLIVNLLIIKMEQR